jgi:hypothetical protein
LTNRERLRGSSVHGVHSGLNTVARSAYNQGLRLHSGMGQVVYPAVRRSLSRVATHLLAGLRLRVRLQGAFPSGPLRPRLSYPPPVACCTPRARRVQ